MTSLASTESENRRKPLFQLCSKLMKVFKDHFTLLSALIYTETLAQNVCSSDSCNVTRAFSFHIDVKRDCNWPQFFFMLSYANCPEAIFMTQTYSL